MRGAGLSLRDALSQTRYRELCPLFEESDLLALLTDHPALIEEWLLYSDDKCTEGGWYLLRDGTIAEIRRLESTIRLASLEQAGCSVCCAGITRSVRAPGTG